MNDDTAKCWTVGPSNMPRSLWDIASHIRSCISPGQSDMGLGENLSEGARHVGPVQQSNTIGTVA